MSLARESSQILVLLRRARRRLLGRCLLAAVCRGTMYSLVGTAVFIGVFATPGSASFPSAGTLIGAASIVAGTLLARAWRHRPTLRVAARYLDTRLDLSQRVETALENIDAHDDIAILLRRDAARRIRHVALQQLIPLRPGIRGRETALAGVVAALALLSPGWFGQTRGFGLLETGVRNIVPSSLSTQAGYGPGAQPALLPEPGASVSGAVTGAVIDLPTPRDADAAPSQGESREHSPPPRDPRAAGDGRPADPAMASAPDILRSMVGGAGDRGEGPETAAARSAGAADGSTGPPPAETPQPGPPAAGSPLTPQAQQGDRGFERYDVPLRLRAYVRDYLLAIGAPR